MPLALASRRGARLNCRLAVNGIQNASSAGLLRIWIIRHTSPSPQIRSEEHTSELQSLMRTSYAVFCLKKKKNLTSKTHIITLHINSPQMHTKLKHSQKRTYNTNTTLCNTNKQPSTHQANN